MCSIVDIYWEVIIIESVKKGFAHEVVSKEDYNGWLVAARDDVSSANQTLMATLEARRTLAQV